MPYKFGAGEFESGERDGDGVSVAKADLLLLGGVLLRRIWRGW
jgi:hypothetical protein